MSEITEAGLHENGTIEFEYFGESNGNAYASCICASTEGKTCEKRFYLTEKALPYTIEDLRLLGVSGETDEEVIQNFVQHKGACDFEVEEKEGKEKNYFTVARVRPVGGEFRMGGLKKLSLAETLSKISGGGSAPSGDDDNLPF